MKNPPYLFWRPPPPPDSHSVRQLWGNTKEDETSAPTSAKQLSLEHVQGVCKVITMAGDVLRLVIARILICLSWKPMTSLSCLSGQPPRWTLQQVSSDEWARGLRPTGGALCPRPVHYCIHSGWESGLSVL